MVISRLLARTGGWSAPRVVEPAGRWPRHRRGATVDTLR